MRRAAVLALLALSACRQGVRAGDPPLPTRWYAKPDEGVSRATAGVLRDLGFRIDADLHERGRIEIEAHRRGERLIARIRPVPPGGCRVTLLLRNDRGSLGESILDHLTERLAVEDSRAPLLTPSTLTVRYVEPPAPCIDAAEEALRQLRLDLTLRDIAPTSAVLASRAPEETAEIRIDDAVTGTIVTFTAGVEGKEGADRRVRRIQQEFERALLKAR